MTTPWRTWSSETDFLRQMPRAAYLLDGYPRTMRGRPKPSPVFSKVGTKSAPAIVIFLDVPSEELVTRALAAKSGADDKRRGHPRSDFRVYHSQTRPFWVTIGILVFSRPLTETSTDRGGHSKRSWLTVTEGSIMVLKTEGELELMHAANRIVQEVLDAILQTTRTWHDDAGSTTSFARGLTIREAEKE